MATPESETSSESAQAAQQEQARELTQPPEVDEEPTQPEQATQPSQVEASTQPEPAVPAVPAAQATPATPATPATQEVPSTKSDHEVQPTQSQKPVLAPKPSQPKGPALAPKPRQPRQQQSHPHQQAQFHHQFRVQQFRSEHQPQGRQQPPQHALHSQRGQRPLQGPQPLPQGQRLLPQGQQTPQGQQPLPYGQPLRPAQPPQPAHPQRNQQPLPQGQQPLPNRQPPQQVQPPQTGQRPPQGQQHTWLPAQQPPQGSQSASERIEAIGNQRSPAPPTGSTQGGSNPTTPSSTPQTFAGKQNEMSCRADLYNALSALDPYKSTPKEFIHLLVKAAMRDVEISKAIHTMNNERILHPTSWQPTLLPQNFPPPQQPQYHSWTPSGANGAPQHAQHPAGVQAPRTPQYVPQGGGQPIQNMQHQPPVAPMRDWQHAKQGAPIPNGDSNQRAAPITNANLVQHAMPTPNNIPRQQVVPVPTSNINPGQHAMHIPNVNPNFNFPPGAANHAVANGAGSNDGEPAEKKEQSCNYTWIVDRTEVHLGWTGNWDKYSEIRQHSIGIGVASKILKLFQQMEKNMEKHKTFPNRVHVLCVMREMLMATLETESIVGTEVRENAQGYDAAYIGAVEKLTPPQRRRLRALEGGKVVDELKELISEAKHQNLFPRLDEALKIIEKKDDE